MEDWALEDLWEFDAEEEYEDLLREVAEFMAGRFFLSSDDPFPLAEEDDNLGYLSAGDWWPLVVQLDEMVNLEQVAELIVALDELLGLPGLPTEVLEEPYAFLEGILLGNLPPQPSGKPVPSSRRVEIALRVVRLLSEVPEAAQAAVRAWASVYRNMLDPYQYSGFDQEDLADLLSDSDLPPAMTGFSMMIALTLMRWPDRAEGLPLPAEFSDPELYEEVLGQWGELPDHPMVAADGEGEAEALFAQGQLAHTLAQLGSEEFLSLDDIDGEDAALAYSRLSRAILWIHNQCRRCPERDEVACKVAANWPERPVPLLDVAGELANTGRIVGCINE
ncbi:MAG: hypothetical protein PVF77_03920 [Anaerolineae bacterium]|jgi:hypothetical protein